MLGESEENWAACVDRAIAMEPDSITIYQMELPYNTTISKDVLKGLGSSRSPLRRGQRSAAGFNRHSQVCRRLATISAARIPRSGIPAKTRFIYTDRLWQGADMLALGVASFGHISGVHVQNLDSWDAYNGCGKAKAVYLSAAPIGRRTRSG